MHATIFVFRSSIGFSYFNGFSSRCESPLGASIVTPEVEGREGIVTTDDYLTIAGKVSGRKLDWFFEVYLRQPKLPKLVSTMEGDELRLRWETPNGMPFPMPVDIEMEGKIRRIEMPNGQATVSFKGNPPRIDPQGWLLREQGL